MSFPHIVERLVGSVVDSVVQVLLVSVTLSDDGVVTARHLLD